MSHVVWFNKNFSSLYNIIQLIKAEDTGKVFRILCTHENPEFVGFEVCDLHEVETISADEPYIHYCLEMCQKHKVSIFYPSKKTTTIARNLDLFEAIGVKTIICADAPTLDVLNHKGHFYDALAGENALLPQYYAVNTLAKFDEACECIKQTGKTICFKPACSLYGLGFKVISDHIRAVDAFLAGDPNRIALGDARTQFASIDRFQDVLVMEYLEGPEYSIDCLAKNSRLVRATVRKKSMRAGGPELLEKNDDLYDLAQKLTAKFHLTGIFNIQARCGDGVPKLLEINPRMAGGIYFSCLAGINYPYWALRMATEDCETEIPTQRFGLRVHQAYQPFVIKE